MIRYIIAILLISSSLYAAPDITGDGDQPVTDGGTFTITGSGFGAKDLTEFVFLRADDIIGAGTDEEIVDSELPTGFSRLSTYLPPIRFDTSQTYHGTYSFRATRIDGYPTYDDYPTPLRYNLPTYQTQVFMSVKARYTVTSGTTGQWKFLRLMADSNVTDPQSGVYASFGDVLRNTVTGMSLMTVACTYANWDECYNDYNDRYIDFPLSQNVWFNTEMTAKHNSSAGATDGDISLSEWSASRGRINTTSPPGLITRAYNSTSTGWDYAAMQNYLGNGILAGSDWFDDWYLSWGQHYLAKIYFCAGGSWSERGQCEIQIPTSWSANSVTFTLNRGTFPVDKSGFVYLMDSAGLVNANGYSVIFGDEGGEDPPADTTAPIVTGQTPSPSATGVAKNTNMEFTCSDGHNNCDVSTMDFTVLGNPWIVDGVINETYATGTVGADGTTVAVSLNPVADFTQLQLVTCVLTVDDTAASPNSGGGTWQFRILQDTVPNTSARFKSSSGGARIRR
jgi:hypothetical protein